MDSLFKNIEIAVKEKGYPFESLQIHFRMHHLLSLELGLQYRCSIERKGRESEVVPTEEISCKCHPFYDLEKMSSFRWAMCCGGL